VRGAAAARREREGRHAMTELVSYAFDGKVATITMDDGKVNVLSPAMQAEL